MPVLSENIPIFSNACMAAHLVIVVFRTLTAKHEKCFCRFLRFSKICQFMMMSWHQPFYVANKLNKFKIILGLIACHLRPKKQVMCISQLLTDTVLQSTVMEKRVLKTFVTIWYTYILRLYQKCTRILSTTNS